MADDAPLILAMDSAAAHCAAALLRGETVLESRVEPMARGQAERLLGLCEELLTARGLGFADLSAIGVGIGPGNFTGIRIAVAAARGLALALERPAIGISGFQALAHGTEGPVLATIQAPRGAVYAQRLGDAEREPGLFSEPGAIPGEWAAPGLSVIGAEAAAIAARLGGQAAEPAFPLPEAIGRAALARLGAEMPPPAPLYLRPADAAPSRDQPPALLP